MESSFRPTRGNAPEKIERAHELRRAQTPEEVILWQALRSFRARGFTFRRQQAIAGFIADFYCHAAHLVVEVDGGVHHTQREYDAERDLVLAGHGLRVMRVANADVRERLPEVLSHITVLLQSNH